MKSLNENYEKASNKKTKLNNLSVSRDLEFGEVEPLLDKVADEEEDDGLTPIKFSKLFLTICVREINTAAKVSKGEDVRIESIKETLEIALMQN
jgi:hypothetical protein